MRRPKILAPVRSLDDINLVSKTKCKSIYVSYLNFLNESDYADAASRNNIFDFIKISKEFGMELFVNFKSSIPENELKNIELLLDFLEKSPISGILINSPDILEYIKDRKLPFKTFIDSGLNIHNLTGIEFINLFHTIDSINITEEIYMSNLIKLKKYSKQKFSIDTDNLPWIAEDIIKSKVIDHVVIKGDFETSEELVKGICLIEKILENPASFMDQKLPFKNNENSYYKSNHFSGEFLSPKGKDFKFAGNIRQFDWKFKRVRTPKLSLTENTEMPRLNIRLTSLEQMKHLKKFLKESKFNPIYSMEYGEIVRTSDLAKYGFNKIMDKVKKDCITYGIKLKLSTPRILTERDFDRVYEYIKLFCIKEPKPTSIIVNNIGHLWAIINDPDFDKINIELGKGLNLINSASILCLANKHKVSSVDLSNISSVENIRLCIEKIKDKIPDRKLIIAGSIRIPSSGLCPLNSDSAILSRLSCAAPCHNGNFAIFDPIDSKLFPITVDGFCRMHLFKDQVLDLFKYIKSFKAIGINEFVIDFSGLSANLVPILLNRFLISLENKDYLSDPNFITEKYEIKDYINV